MVTVSIVVPCFNAEGYISEAIRSVQAQTMTDWECILIDDCSTDGTLQIIQRHAEVDRRLRPIALQKNGGASAARNAGLDAARGKWITLLDADDLYESQRLAKLVQLAESTRSEMVFDNQSIAEFPASSPAGTAFRWLTNEVQPFDRDGFFLESAVFGRSLNPGYMKPMFSRFFLERHGLRYDLNFRSGQDYLFYAHAFAQDPRCFATNHCGYIYRRRHGSLSRGGGRHLRNHARLSDEITRRYGDRLPRAVHKALARRKRYFESGAALNDLRVALSDRDWISAARLALTDHKVHFGLIAALRKRLAGTR